MNDHTSAEHADDVMVTLVAPDASTYRLPNRTGGNTANINQTYTVNLSAEPANGTGRLRVQDAAAADVGRIDSWTISLPAARVHRKLRDVFDLVCAPEGCSASSRGPWKPRRHPGVVSAQHEDRDKMVLVL